jgi:hypothetical protein
LPKIEQVRMLPHSTLTAALTVLAMSASAYPTTTGGSRLSSVSIPPASLENDSTESLDGQTDLNRKDSVSMSSQLFAHLSQELRTRFSKLNRLPSSCEASYSQLKNDVYRIIKAECETTANFDLDTFNKDFEESFQKRMEDGGTVKAIETRKRRPPKTGWQRGQTKMLRTLVCSGSIVGFCVLLFPTTLLGKWVVDFQTHCERPAPTRT